ncbi:50S ribosomal protein L21 [bacterium]|nr:50S ribosomal protein L21 [bacterium]
MFAIIETGGKQYKVAAGTIIDVEKLEAEPNTTLTFDKVLLVSGNGEPKIGQPYVEGASVKATVLNQVKDDKVIVFKFKPKTGYKRKAGHRQPLTTIKVESISA